jgi:hypothetical protein
LVKYGSRWYFSTGENQSYTQRSLLANSTVVQLTGLPTNKVSWLYIYISGIQFLPIYKYILQIDFVTF